MHEIDVEPYFRQLAHLFRVSGLDWQVSTSKEAQDEVIRSLSGMSLYFLLPCSGREEYDGKSTEFVLFLARVSNG